MPRIAYIDKRFNAASLAKIRHANAIIDEYRDAGFTLTLRQLYYQFVSRELVPNTQKSYKALGSIINDARLAGYIDWEAIEDRTRNLRSRSHWDDPAGVIDSAAASYGLDLWQGQSRRCEVWIEKDALVGVIERVCQKWDVPFFSCRGYTSQSELWGAAMRHRRHEKNGQRVTVIHLGDHDPSGLDMTRDIDDRFQVFGASTTVQRHALNMDQVETYKLPPNPAKATDARFAAYEAKHGDESWELDALDPKRIEAIIEKAIKAVVDGAKFAERFKMQERDRGLLEKVSRRWDDVETFITDGE